MTNAHDFETRRGAIEDALGTPLTALHRVTGGNINMAVVADCESSRVFVKWNDRPLPRQFEAEARGLNALRNAIDPRFGHVPTPLAWSDAPGRSFLAMTYFERGRPRQDYSKCIGRALASIHRATSSLGFGFDLDGYCGATPQPNPRASSWTEFYREHRLAHQIRLARERGLGTRDVSLLERVAEGLDAFLPVDPEPPSLLHGDLWAGNVIVASDGLPVLLDPAAYYGDREAEFGMMRWFGDFDERTYAAYRECYPLRDGANARLELYRLYHVLNHFHLFGGGYGAEAVAIARRCLS